jgi:hypothetical protein
MLRLTTHGDVLWPDGSTETIAHSQLLMPAWCKQHEQDDPVIALIAGADIPLALAHPLLATAEELGLHSAILAISPSATTKVVSDVR